MNEAAQQPQRVVIYYALLFLFIFLTYLLFKELSATYDLMSFARINELLKNAFDYWKNFDEVAATLFALLLAFIFALPVAWIYTLTKAGETYDSSLVQTIVVLTMVVTGVMIVVGTELARAFGLVGVVAAVRFRNTLKDTKDAVYVFIAVAIGMACGFGVYHIAVLLSMAMSLTMFLLWKFKFGEALREAAVLTGRSGKKAVQAAYEQTSASTLERVFERQLRLRQWAELSAEKEKKKANAALIIKTNDPVAAQNFLEKALNERGGKWQLAHAQNPAEGPAILEFVGRTAKEEGPAKLIHDLRENGKSLLNEIEYLSLKGAKNTKAKASEARDDDD